MIFDLDGTLLNTIGDLAAAANHTLAEMGFAPHTEEEYKYMVGNGIPKLIERFLPPGHRDKATQAQAARLFFPYYDAHKEDATAPYPGIPALLAELRRRGCKLGVLSNKFDSGVQFIMNKCLSDAVDVQHGEGGPQNFPRKPDPVGLLTTIEELGSTPARTVYIGDSPGDIHVARNAGCYAVGVDWGYHDPADFAAEGWEPDLLVSDPEQILALAPEA